MKSLPDHLFLAAGGDLFDTRKPEWYKHPLRERYSYPFHKIDTVSKFKASLRCGPYAWPGGYPMYFVTTDGGVLSFKAARENFRLIVDSIKTDRRDGWQVCGLDIYHKDEDELLCDHTGEEIK